MKKIGSGASADVFKTTKDGKNFALKVFKAPDEESMMNDLTNEIKYASQVPENLTA